MQPQGFQFQANSQGEIMNGPVGQDKAQTNFPQLRLATDLAKQGHYDEAIVALKTLLDDEPNNELALGLLAATYLQIGYHEKAVNVYETLLQVNAVNPLARFQLGLAHLNSGAAETALQTWEPLLDQEQDFMAHFHSALALLQLDRREQAETLLMHASRTMPVSHPLYPTLLELIVQYCHDGKAGE